MRDTHFPVDPGRVGWGSRQEMQEKARDVYRNRYELVRRDHAAGYVTRVRTGWGTTGVGAAVWLFLGGGGRRRWWHFRVFNDRKKHMGGFLGLCSEEEEEYEEWGYGM